MAFTDDLAGLSRAEQIARVQAVAREHGDELDESRAAQALDLYAALAADPDGCEAVPGAARRAVMRITGRQPGRRSGTKAGT